MSKKLQRYDDQEFDDSERGYRDELNEHRREKRMKNALKTRNLEDLIDYDENYW